MLVNSYNLKTKGEQPLVSVIIPAYNAERFIAQTLESVLAQTYRNIEVLVVDDGSQDETAAIVRRYMQRDTRVNLFQQTNAGVAAARNLGINKSQGVFIAPLDADDLWFPENIEKQVKRLLSAGQDVGLVYSWSRDIDEYTQPTGYVRASRIEGKVYTTLLLHDFIANASSVLIRKSCLELVGGYDSALKQNRGQGGEDWDIYLRIAERYEFRLVPEILVGYRKTSGSMSTDSIQMARSRQLIWQKLRHQYPHIPAFIERLSNSSFYLHLAAQSNQDSRPKVAIKWIVEALKTDPVTTSIRPGFYKIVLIAILKSWIQTIPFLTKSNTNLKCLKVDSSENSSGQKKRQLKNTWRPKALGEIIIHSFATRFLRKTEQWL